MLLFRVDQKLCFCWHRRRWKKLEASRDPLNSPCNFVAEVFRSRNFLAIMQQSKFSLLSRSSDHTASLLGEMRKAQHFQVRKSCKARRAFELSLVENSQRKFLSTNRFSLIFSQWPFTSNYLGTWGSLSRSLRDVWQPCTHFYEIFLVSRLDIRSHFKNLQSFSEEKWKWKLNFQVRVERWFLREKIFPSTHTAEDLLSKLTNSLREISPALECVCLRSCAKPSWMLWIFKTFSLWKFSEQRESHWSSWNRLTQNEFTFLCSLKRSIYQSIGNWNVGLSDERRPRSDFIIKITQPHFSITAVCKTKSSVAYQTKRYFYVACRLNDSWSIEPFGTAR